VHLVFIENAADSVEALRILLERRKLQSTVAIDGNRALEACNTNPKGSCIIANPACLKADIGAFLQRAARSNIPVIVHEHMNNVLDQSDYPSNVVQVIPKNAAPEIASVQITLTVKQLKRHQLLEKRHLGVSETLGLEKDLSKVVNVYSTILDLGYDKVAVLIRDYARRNRVRISSVVEQHKPFLAELTETNYAESIRDCRIEAPILRELTMGSRLSAKRRHGGHEF